MRIACYEEDLYRSSKTSKKSKSIWGIGIIRCHFCVKKFYYAKIKLIFRQRIDKICIYQHFAWMAKKPLLQVLEEELGELWPLVWQKQEQMLLYIQNGI
jgi:hypothetical protein